MGVKARMSKKNLFVKGHKRHDINKEWKSRHI